MGKWLQAIRLIPLQLAEHAAVNRVVVRSSRTIFSRNGDNVIVKNPDLEWYGGDVCCTEYTAELDEANAALMLKGITTWISSSLDSDERRLELDASPLSAKYTVVEVSNEKITAIELSGNILTR